MEFKQIRIKPLSVNEAWKGRRFKSLKYQGYEKEVLLRLLPMKIPEGELKISLEFGMPIAMDIDNPVNYLWTFCRRKWVLTIIESMN